jgi:hypothetical protein
MHFTLHGGAFRYTVILKPPVRHVAVVDSLRGHYTSERRVRSRSGYTSPDTGAVPTRQASSNLEQGRMYMSRLRQL